MEFVEGKDLQRTVEEQGPLDFETAVDYVRQAAEGLTHAHGRQMIHCDIKPSNLLVNPQGVVKILDMGMARLSGPGRNGSEGQGERLLGTVDYMAPEQAVEGPEFDQRADIYSLGCTLYFLLSGHPPFPEGTLAERIAKHQAQEPRSLAEVRPDTPKDLVKICRKMIAKSPGERYQSAAELARVLADWRPTKPRLLRAVPLESSPEAPAPGAAAPAVAPWANSPKPAPAAAASPLLSDPRRLALWIGLPVLGVFLAVGVLIAVLAAPAPKPLPVPRPSVEQAPPDQEEPSSFPKPKEVKSWDEGLNEPQAAAPGPNPPQPAPAAAPPAEPPKPPVKEQPKAEPSPPPKPEPRKEQPKPEPPKEKPTPEPPREAPQPPQPPKEQPTPEPPKPAPPKPPQSKDPLAEFPKSVVLPELTGERGGGAKPGEPFLLGKIDTPPDAAWQLQLLGGEGVLKGNRKFTLQVKDNSAAKAAWLVQVEGKTPGLQAPAPAAEIYRDGGSLMLRYPQGAEPAAANFLRNCVLEVRAGGQSRLLMLRPAVPVEPIGADLVKGFTMGHIPLPFLPEAADLRVEVIKVEGRDGATIQPAEPASPNTPILILFLRRDRHGNDADKAALRLTFTHRASALAYRLQLFEPPPLLFKGIQVAVARNLIEEARKKIEKDLQNEKGEKRSQLDAQLDDLEKRLWYVNFYDQVHGKARVHFRVYVEAGDQRLVLATTDPQ